MTGTSKVLRYVALGIILLIAVLGALFAAGYAFSDLPLWIPLLETVVWLGIAVGLTVMVFRATTVAVPVMLAVTVLVAVLLVVDGGANLFQRNELGPVSTVFLLAVFVPLAFLGLKRPALAGAMLGALAVAQALAGGLLRRSFGAGFGFGAMFGGSSGVVVLPALLAAVLFLVAGFLVHDSWRLRPVGGARMAH